MRIASVPATVLGPYTAGAKAASTHTLPVSGMLNTLSGPVSLRMALQVMVSHARARGSCCVQQVCFHVQQT